MFALLLACWVSSVGSEPTDTEPTDTATTDTTDTEGPPCLAELCGDHRVDEIASMALLGVPGGLSGTAVAAWNPTGDERWVVDGAWGAGGDWIGSVRMARVGQGEVDAVYTLTGSSQSRTGGALAVANADEQEGLDLPATSTTTATTTCWRGRQRTTQGGRRAGAPGSSRVHCTRPTPPSR